MNVEQFRDYCLAKNSVEECFPFDDVTLVFKVAGKNFAITGLDNQEFKVNLKCDPERAVQLREAFPDAILPGFHMSKKHWNTVHFDAELEDKLLKELIDHSYELALANLSKKVKLQFGLD